MEIHIPGATRSLQESKLPVMCNRYQGYSMSAAKFHAIILHVHKCLKLMYTLFETFFLSNETDGNKVFVVYDPEGPGKA